MDIKIAEKSAYTALTLVLCPGCGKRIYSTGLKVHLINSAKKEALELCCGDIQNTPHLDLYKKHREKRKIDVIPKHTINFNFVK